MCRDIEANVRVSSSHLIDLVNLAFFNLCCLRRIRFFVPVPAGCSLTPLYSLDQRLQLIGVCVWSPSWIADDTPAVGVDAL
jgi:hypothetical protein